MDEEEDVTEEFRAAVRATLERNAQRNRLAGARKGDPGYLVSNRAELAESTGTDKTMINKIIGPARSSTRVKLVTRSAFVGRIREVLRMPPVVQITVPASRAAVVRAIASLPDDEFRIFEESVGARSRTKNK